jgi:hypothetical protein
VGPPVCDPGHRSTCRAIRAPPILLQTAICIIYWGFRFRLNLRSVHEGSVPRSNHHAFSPTSAASDHERPAKRPISLAVEIPQSTAAGAHTPSPLESLQSFSKLPLGSSCAFPVSRERCYGSVCAAHSVQTLIASYQLDPTKPRPVSKVSIVLIFRICPRMLTGR